VRQRNLYGIVFLLAVGLTALHGQVPGQNAGTPPWATAGSEPVVGMIPAPAVIASTHLMLPGQTLEAHLPLPDDGLKPVLSKQATAAARPASPPPSPPPPRPLPQGTVQRAIYLAQGERGPGKVDPGVIPAGGVGTAPEVPPPSREGSMLSLQVQGPSSSAPGQTLSCTVIARNPGSVVLAGVRVTLPLPETVRLIASEPVAERHGNTLEWHLGNLEVGSERRLKVDLITSEAGQLRLCPSALFSVAVGLHTRIVRPPFSLTVTAPENATIGSLVNWNIQVRNFTAKAIHRVVLTCRLSAGLGHPQGDTIETEVSDVEPGQERTLKLPVQALSPGRRVISLTATADGGLTAQAQGIVKVEELTLTLVAKGPRNARVGEDLTYHLELANPGSNSSGTIRLTQVLPEGLEFTSASHGGRHNPATQTISWTLEGLAPQQKHEVTFQARARNQGDWALAASLQIEGLAEVRTTHAIRIAASPLLRLEVTAHDNPVTLASETTYEVRVYNQGTVPASGVRLRMVLPDNLLPIQASAPTRWQIQGQQVHFAPVEQMRGRVAAVYRIRMRGVREGIGRFRIELTAEGLPKPIEQELTCRIQQPLASGR
jgi:uncharacterized repeat protein (TIGR01451 family)